MKVAVLDDYQDVARHLVDWTALQDMYEVVFFHNHFSSTEVLKDQMQAFEIIVAMRERTSFNRQLLMSLPKLKLLITTGMRNASIDLNAATDYGILVCGAGGGGYATVELTWGLIISLLRHIPHEDNMIRRGRWQTTLGTELDGKTLGIIGLGHLGAKVAKIGNAFGMQVIAWSQNLDSLKAKETGALHVTKDELLKKSDIITIHLRLSDRTRGLIGSRELAMMKSTSYLINTSRGPIIDELALINAVESGSIAGVGLDVYDQEPLPVNHPLRSLKNTVITPHLGYVTIETYKKYYTEIIEDIIGYSKGTPVRMLNQSLLGGDGLPPEKMI